MNELIQLLRRMDVPPARIDPPDIRWLSRNLPLRNSEHPDFPKAWEIVRREVKKLYAARP